MHLPQHVGTNEIHLLIEFIAKRVNPGEAMQHFCEIPSFKLMKQLTNFFVQSMAKVVDCGIDSIVNARQRDIVRGRTGIVDDCLDKFSCGFRFPLDLRAFLLESLQLRRSARFVWRRASRRVVKAEGPERLSAEWWRTSASEAKRPRTRDYYRQEQLRQVLEEHINGRQNHEKLLWSLLNLEIWHREFNL